jgi:hypothetical protein
VTYQSKFVQLFIVKLCWPGLEEEKEYEGFILMAKYIVACVVPRDPLPILLSMQWAEMHINSLFFIK